MPIRIQRQRARGWKMPPNTIYVGRPTPMGNPFRADPKTGYTAEEAVADFAAWLDAEFPWGTRHGAPPLLSEIRALRGFNLCCWCGLDQPCHADVLLALANTVIPSQDDAK